MSHNDELAALRRCAELYAAGADRRDKDLWRQVLSDDCVIEGPSFSNAGIETNLGMLEMLGQMFRATRHCVHNQIATVVGDSASGETYCTAEHLLTDTDAILVWAVRYQDTWRRENGNWRFTHRKLIVDWEETRPVKLIGEQS